MNAQTLARTAYATAAEPTRTPRAAEYAVFARITQRLNAARLEGTGGFGRLAAALHENRRLWSVLAADVAEPTNALPGDLRARIFQLAQFTGVHTSRVLAGAASADVLIDINLAVMRGLRGEGDGA